LEEIVLPIRVRRTPDIATLGPYFGVQVCGSPPDTFYQQVKIVSGLSRFSGLVFVARFVLGPRMNVTHSFDTAQDL
jgi:hypothetical protein